MSFVANLCRWRKNMEIIKKGVIIYLRALLGYEKIRRKGYEKRIQKI